MPSERHKRIAVSLLHEIPPPPPRKVRVVQRWMGLSPRRWLVVDPDPLTGQVRTVRIGSSLFKSGSRLEVVEVDSAGAWLSAGGRSIRLNDENWHAYLRLEAKPRKGRRKDADAGKAE